MWYQIVVEFAADDNFESIFDALDQLLHFADISNRYALNEYFQDNLPPIKL